MMKGINQYVFEYVLIVFTIFVSIAGFWKIYVGADVDPNGYHHLHVLTDFVWLFLLLYQLRLVDSKQHARHRQVGIVVMLIAPLLFATTALLSVNSAYKGVTSGKGDFLIVQNVGVTLEVGLLILMAFILRKKRKVHGACLASTAILMMGIALFFTLISFVPGYTVDGPDGADRFQKAGITAQTVSIVVGVLMFLKDVRNGWPYLLSGAFFLVNEAIRSYLSDQLLIQPLTEFVGSLNQPITFVGSFVALLAMLAATGVQRSRLRETTRM